MKRLAEREKGGRKEKKKNKGRGGYEKRVGQGLGWSKKGQLVAGCCQGKEEMVMADGGS